MTTLTQITTAYFSGTNTTKRIVEAVTNTIAGNDFKGEIKEYDLLASAPDETVTPPYGSLTIVGVPVYAGRIPALARMRLEQFQGNHTPAIAIAVYGNRAYDDALLELVDAIAGNGFTVFAAAVFIAQHSIFPKVAANRPDAKDMEQVAKFSNKCADYFASGLFDSAPVKVPGKRPYVTPGKSIGLQPLIDQETCTLCNACVKVCPTHAISLDPETDRLRKDLNRCIPCSACVRVCPTGSQNYRGKAYNIFAEMFAGKNAQRREPEFFFL